MRRNAWFCVVMAGAAFLTGCVERRYVIDSQPRGAAVFRNGVYIGATPVDEPFTYYGKYHYTLVLEGYETLQVDQEITTPWYEYLGLDFISENLTPHTLRDVRRFLYALQPLQVPDSEKIANRAQELRNRGQALQAPPTTP